MKTSFRFINFDEIDSTNTYALKMIDTYEIQKKTELLNGTVITADKQTKGRGRMNRKFYSPGFTGLYMSVIYFPKRRIITPSLITPLAAVSVSRALSKKWGIETQIKWVNDIYLDSKKICGILAEGHIDTKKGMVDSVVIGFGLNLFNTRFPDELKDKAGSVFTDKNYTSEEIINLKKELAELITEEFFELLNNEEEICNGEPEKKESLMIAMKEYRDRSFLIGKTVELFPVINNSRRYKVQILDITDKGQLKVLNEDGKIHFVETGEVSLSTI